MIVFIFLYWFYKIAYLYFFLMGHTIIAPILTGLIFFYFMADLLVLVFVLLDSYNDLQNKYLDQRLK